MKARRSPDPFFLAALLAAASPLLLLIEFLAYVLRARLYLGHWPYYNNPDPKQLGWWIQHRGLQLGLLAFPALTLAAIALAALGRARSREFPLWTVVATAILACAALLAFTRIDPGGFMDWFWD